ncbi:carboxypeptidase-like regulatory domain-containing protein [Acidicapsa acidisoli]|uniref:carboxypeptidase-like regulatory domain-containing protein n=1 Tax=Acidicapsa acidisoli TaxID=1615681 RepID=UPI0021DFB23E|nr:carboxypeptidase-like regulatory domain-containing protein [Acidicapsa acidisoli]
MGTHRSLGTLLILVSVALPALTQNVLAPGPQTGTIIGTVVAVDDSVIPGATVVLDGPSPGDRQTVESNESGFFKIDRLKPATPYHITVRAKDFANWSSASIVLKPGQFLNLGDITLQIEVVETTVAAVSPEQLATQQVEIEEKQHVLGFIPNYYVVYDPNAAPLTSKLKFRLAFKTSINPVTFAGSAFIAGIDQAAGTPNYVQGVKGYGQRFGANYANGLTDIMIGGAILPSLLHQDPRYFYQGTGTTKSRLRHALTTPFWCKGDNGRWQPNYSSMGGYLGSGAIANTYYPVSNRGPGLVFGTFFVNVAADMANGVLQEFVLRRFTPGTK